MAGSTVPPEAAPETADSGPRPVAEAAGTTVAPWRRRRFLRWSLVGLMLLVVCAPLGLWMHYRAVHVLSRNAMVRGNLAEIGTRLDGVLASIEVEEGARVTAGQVLGRLEDSHLRAEVAEAQAALDGLERQLSVERLAIAHQQRLLDTRLREAEADRIAADAQVAAARSEADNARESYRQRKTLLQSQAISKERIRFADTKRQTTKAMLTVAQERRIAAQLAKETVELEIDGLAIRRQKLGVLEADVARARARLEGARADLESAVIRAPDDGAVVRWLVKLGGPVKVGRPLLSMWLGTDVWIEAWVDEDEIAGVRTGAEATVTLQAFPDREFTGVVEQIGLTTDFELPLSEDVIPQPRFARMRGAPVVGILVRLRDPQQRLLPGLSALVAIRENAGG